MIFSKTFIAAAAAIAFCGGSAFAAETIRTGDPAPDCGAKACAYTLVSTHDAETFGLLTVVPADLTQVVVFTGPEYVGPQQPQLFTSWEDATASK